MWREKTVVTHFVEPPREYMLEKTTYELHGRECHDLPAMITGVFIAEGDLSIAQCDYPIVGYGNAMNVTCQILDDSFWSLNAWLDVNYPVVDPY
jgi:hypothetical protein